MFDTFASVRYPFALATHLPESWSLMTASLGSAGLSWGVGSIARDAEDMAKIVAYIKGLRPNGKVVIMGHSTGCQDCVEYVIGKGSAKRIEVDGVVLQAPVSDREALANELPETFKHEADQLALSMCREGRERDCMPYSKTKGVFGRIGITARRWVDVSSPGPDHAGADDYFSSDLSDERLKATFGKFTEKTPLLVLQGGEDTSIPESVDKEKLVQRWAKIVKDAGGIVDESSGVVAGASHNYNGNKEEVVQDMVKRVVTFVGRIGGGASSGGAARM